MQGRRGITSGALSTLLHVVPKSHEAPSGEAARQGCGDLGHGVLQHQVGGCQNYGPFLDTLNIRCRIIIGIQKGTIILTTT